MALEPGTRIGPYEIVAPLGAGGMGEVYRANDTRLKRDVAIKILPDDLARDPERLARFEREAQVLASVNHPNIASIYGVEEAGTMGCLVLELVEGETLGSRIDAGPVPVPEVVPLALQIAGALEAAHEKGIVHRDLKPANVMLSPDGTVKILDFGLAKALDADASGVSTDNSLSPTMTTAATRAGVILGTAGYMSPEQARGKSVDRRSDIWAFGVLLFEMLTGSRLFTGETVSDKLAGILRADVDWGLLPAETPAGLRKLLGRCLERDPLIRLRDIGEARISLADIAAGRVTEEVPPKPTASRAGWSPALSIGLIVLAAVAAGLAAWSVKPSVPIPSRKFHILARDLRRGPSHAISPDGQSIAFADSDKLWVRRLDKLEAREIPGTKGASVPFWSPDSQWIGYIADDKVWKVAVAGGESSLLTKMPAAGVGGVGASWGPDGRIVMAPGSGSLYEIPSLGGDARLLLEPDPERGDDHFHEPHWLPEGRGLLFTIHTRDGKGVDTLALLDGGERRVLLELKGQEIWRPTYSPTGHILFRRQPDNAGIWALPFSLSSKEPAGEPFLVVPGGNNPSVSEDATLVCVLGGGTGMQQLVWVDREGGIESTVGQPQPEIRYVALSPSGDRAAVTSHEGDNWDVWIHDVERATKSRLTFDEAGQWGPDWSPDGSRVVYSSGGNLEMRAADGSGDALPLSEGRAPSFSPDGSWILFARSGQESVDEIWRVSLEKETEAELFIKSNEDVWGPRVSPDGKYLAYTSEESGRQEVYLTRFPEGGGKWQVSVDGGTMPIWSRPGDEIIFRHYDVLMSVPVELGPSPRLGTPHLLFDASGLGLSIRPRAFDISLDGSRILTVKELEHDDSQDQIVVITNWSSEFARQP